MFTSLLLKPLTKSSVSPFTLLSRGLSSPPSPSLGSISKFGNVLGGSFISPESLATFQAWHACVDVGVKGGEVDGAVEIFKDHVDDNVKFYPPTYFAHWEGRDEFLVLISQVGAVFGPSFTYHRQWLSDDGKDWCLEFKAEIEGDNKSVVEGVDLVKLNDEGKIVDFRVLARPPNAVEALKNAMMRRVPGPMARMKAAKGFNNLFGMSK